jgi:prepilin-type N-terminal cleavage/methylation domain-containing protein
VEDPVDRSLYPMRPRASNNHASGFSLIELLWVIAILGICLAVLAVSVAAGLRNGEARGAAQVWQTAAAWAQVGVTWEGGTGRVQCDSSGLVVSTEPGATAGDLGNRGPVVPVTTNLARWRIGDGVVVTYKDTGAPDGGGSVYFQAWRHVYRVVVRPESGLTARSVLE